MHICGHFTDSCGFGFKIYGKKYYYVQFEESLLIVVLSVDPRVLSIKFSAAAVRKVLLNMCVREVY